MAKKKIRAVFFAIMALALFWLVYRKSDFKSIYAELGQFNAIWIIISIGINLISQYVRAVRWKMLITPLGYRPRTNVLFLSVLILGFTNQVIPRGGEVARLGIVNRYERISVGKLTGVALAERLVDLVLLLSIFAGVILWQWENFQSIINLPDLSYQDVNIWKKILVIAAVIAIVALTIWLIVRLNLFKKFKGKLKEIKHDFNKGFGTIKLLKHKVIFGVLSISIYILWFAMSYVLFFAYPPTSGLNAGTAAFTFGLATMAFLLPIQAGMGAWHFVVVQCLMLFGIAAETGKTFALVAHASNNLVYLFFGLIAFAALPFLNKAENSMRK